jgi:hypothetical protein
MIEDWDQFEKCLVDFHQLLVRHLFNLDEVIPAWRALAANQASQCLRDEYGPSGKKAAFDMARTGNEGGLYKVLQVIAKRMAEGYADNEIGARVTEYLNSLTVDERLRAAEEYVDKYGHLLPSEVTEASAVRIKMNLQKVLEHHPRLIKNLRRAGRS